MSEAWRPDAPAQAGAPPYRNPGLEGVNVCGYLRTEDGIGAVARSYVNALQSLQVPVSLMDVSRMSPQRSGDLTSCSSDVDHSFPVNLVCVNADQHFRVAASIGRAFFEGRYNIGVWFWELPSFPKLWLDRFPEYDEIWASSSFIANALTPVSPIPIIRVPPIVRVDRGGSRQRGRNRIGAGDDDFLFLFTFDFHSYVERKNPLALIEAFKRAFAPREAAHLIIKCVNGARRPDVVLEMQGAARGHAIRIYDEYWDQQDILDLKAASDAYVSLHRSEGLGLGIADAMALGKPVIATGWSGNMDLMNVGNSYPVRFELVVLPETYGPYQAGETWAEPIIDHAVDLMRHVFENREEARAIGRAAQKEIEGSCSVERVTRVIRQRLDVIHDRLGVTVPCQLDSVATDAASGAMSASHAESPSSRTSAVSPDLPPLELGPSRGWVWRRCKDIVAALLGHHTHYQQRVNQGFSTYLQRLVADRDDMGRHISGAESRLRVSDRALAQLSQEAARRDARLADALTATRQQIRVLSGRLHELTEGHESTTQGLHHIQEAVASLRTLEIGLADLGRSLTAYEIRLDQLAAGVAHIGYRLSARPFMAKDLFGANGNREQSMGYGPVPGDADGEGGTPLRFADLFRGAHDFILDRQRAYLPLVAGARAVLDLGCGRGEFLQLLRENGIAAMGVELDPALVTQGRERGLHVVHADAIDYLREQPGGSLDLIFSAQFIEHIEPSRLIELLTLARQCLRPGGRLIAETVNPESYEALKTFYVDLSHQKPIFPQVLLYLCRLAGFPIARIFYPQGGGFTQECFDTVAEYAVEATT